MSREIACGKCGKYMGLLAAGSRVSRGMVFLCRECGDTVLSSYSSVIPNFLRGFCGGGKR